MKDFLIASAAALALISCSAPVEDTETHAELLAQIENETDLDKLLQLQADASEKIEQSMEVKMKANMAVSSLFLKENANADGVETSESGLQYKVIQAGLENGAQAEPGQGIAAHYHGTFIDGEVFDSSYQRGRPLNGPSNGFILGWNEALGDMRVCEARTLYIKSDLAYGDRGRGGIPGGATLIFNMQLLAVEGEGDAEHTCPEEKILAGPDAYN